MSEARVLRERKKVINYSEDAVQQRAQRKVADLIGERHKTRSSKQAGGTDKENRRKRERLESLSLTDSESGGNSENDSDGGPSHPPAKRAATSKGVHGDATEDNHDEANAFIAFSRPGRRPTPRQPAKPQGRPTRAAAACASRRICNATTNDEEEEQEEKEDCAAAGGSTRRADQPARAAAAAAKVRLRRGTAAAKGRGCHSLDAEGSEEDSKKQEARTRGSGAKSAGGKGGADAMAIDDSGSSGDSESDEDEEMEEVGLTVRGKPSASKLPGARCKKPMRTCARSAGTVAKTSKKKEQEEESSEGSEGNTGLEDDDDDDDEDFTAPSRRETAAGRRGRLRQPSRGKAASSDNDDDEDEDSSSEEEEEEDEAGVARVAARGNRRCDTEDSDVELINDSGDDDDDEAAEEEDGDEASSEEGKEEAEENPVRRGRGRPRKEGGKAARDSPARGKGRKQQPKAAGAAAKKALKGQSAQKGNAKEEVGKMAAAGGGSKKHKGPVERILSYDSAKDKYLVKLKDVSYRHTTYVTQSHLEKFKPNLLRSFQNREEAVEVEAEWLQVDRVIAARTVSTPGRQGKSRQLLIKWRGLEYSDSTWENEEELQSPEDKAAIERFERINGPTAATGKKQPDGTPQALRQPGFELPTFCNERSLRDYQQVSVRWMVNNYCQRRNCILGDEMGLGKTAQSISCLEVLRSVGGIPGPFLIVAPLSTLGHWQREIQTWTDMNVVFLSGTAADRAVILEHEFYRSPGSTAGVRNSRKEIKFNVLLVSYNTLLKERSLLGTVSWAAAVFDEAHRLKGINSSTRAAVEDLDIDWLLLLTGTPIQNNMLELYSILSLLDPDGYPTPEDFTSRFGGAPGGSPPTVEQIRALQDALAPILLRRMKEDVEELPQKEEVVVWVELTAHQRAYYRALYEGQIGALMGGASAKNLPSMRNLAMELRKLCCHPVLCEGLEEDLKFKLAQQRSQGAPEEFKSPEVELLVRGSGKMVLLHKLLHKLRAEGRRVLIFSQFVIMLNVLEDYCNAVGFPVERIDGSIQGRDRQRAIDRFCAEGEGSDGAFVFLLSTRAGGQGITLTAADTCIIYDSDWNPQNDLQAMARCHRIGQKKEVTVYRLISRDTYEMALFNSASRKYGLDEAILGFSGGSDPESDSARIAELLRHGAHGLLADMEAGLRQGEAFASEDINQILAARTEKRQIGSRAGNTFSVATFAADDGGAAGGETGGGLGGLARRGRAKARRRGGSGGEGEGEDDDLADKDYWRTLMPDAVAAHETRVAEGPVILGPRKRKQINYNMNDKKYNPKLDSDDSSDDDADDSGDEGQQVATGEGREGGSGGGGGGEDGEQSRRKSSGRTRKQQRVGLAEAAAAGQEAGQEAGQTTGGKGRARKAPRGGWTKSELKALEERLVALGPDRWEEVYQQLQPFKHSAADVEAGGRAMWRLYQIAEVLGAEQKVAKKKAELEARAVFEASIPLLPDLDEIDDFTSGAPKAPGPAADTAAAAVASTTPAAAQRPPPTAAATPAGPDRYEEELAKAISEEVPGFLHGALSGAAPVKRLLKEAAENLRHGKNMNQLMRLMRPKQQPQHNKDSAEAPAVAEAGAGSISSGGNAVNGLRACYMPPPFTPNGFLSWWSRADDEALLMAAAEVGYVPGKPSRTVEYALLIQPLAGRVVQKPEQQQLPDQPPPKDGAQAAAEAETEKPSDTTGDVRSAGAGSDQAKATEPSAPPALRAPGPGGPLQLDPCEWRVLVATLSRRLNKVITTTLDLQHKLAANAKKQPLVVSKCTSPSGPLLNRGPPTAAAGGGTIRPQGDPVAAAGVTAVPAAAAATVVKLVVATAAAAAAKYATSGNKAAPPGDGGVHKVATAAAGVGGGGSIPGQQPHQQQQQHHHHGHHQRHQQQGRPSDPQGKVGDPTKQQQPDRPQGTGAAAATPMTAAAGGSGKTGVLKQSTLPFARRGSAGTQPKAAAGPSGGSGDGDAKVTQAAAPGAATAYKSSPSKGDALAAAAARATAALAPASGKVVAKAAIAAARVEPGSAEKPIEISEDD